MRKCVDVLRLKVFLVHLGKHLLEVHVARAGRLKCCELAVRKSIELLLGKRPPVHLLRTVEHVLSGLLRHVFVAILLSCRGVGEAVNRLLVVELWRLTDSRAICIREPTVFPKLLHKGQIVVGGESRRGIVVGTKVVSTAVRRENIKIQSALLLLRILLRFGTAVLEPVLCATQPRANHLAHTSTATTYIDLFERYL